jgi:hypothetical protein
MSRVIFSRPWTTLLQSGFPEHTSLHQAPVSPMVAIYHTLALALGRVPRQKNWILPGSILQHLTASDISTRKPFGFFRCRGMNVLLD